MFRYIFVPALAALILSVSTARAEDSIVAAIKAKPSWSGTAVYRGKNFDCKSKVSTFNNSFEEKRIAISFSIQDGKITIGSYSWDGKEGPRAVGELVDVKGDTLSFSIPPKNRQRRFDLVLKDATLTGLFTGVRKDDQSTCFEYQATLTPR